MDGVGIINSPLFTLLLQIVKDFGFSLDSYYQKNCILRGFPLFVSLCLKSSVAWPCHL